MPTPTLHLLSPFEKLFGFPPTTLNFGCLVTYVISGFILILNIKFALIPHLVFFLVTLPHKVPISVLICPHLKHIFLVMSTFLKNHFLYYSTIPSLLYHSRAYFQMASTNPKFPHFTWLTQCVSRKRIPCVNIYHQMPNRLTNHPH